MWLAKMLKSFLEQWRHDKAPHEKMQESKRQSRFTYRDGPMLFIGQQIVKAMQDAGYPAKIVFHYRSEEEQNLLYAKGRTIPGPDVSPKRPMGRTVTRAKAWQSPHNVCEAVDIVHKTKGWQASDEFWDTLNACARNVAERFGIELIYGYDWGWDLAHIETKDWRRVRDDIFQKTNGQMRPPTPRENWARFEELLPAVAKQHKRSAAWREPLA